MTEPSKAAKRKALELAEADSPLFRESAAQVLLTLARVLQEHSDVAKALVKHARNTDGALGAYGFLGDIPNRLQSLILPDEPLDDLTVVEGYQLQPDGTRARMRVALRDMRIVEDKGPDRCKHEPFRGTWFCWKCGDNIEPIGGKA